jgi:type I restriction enzyme S subunit
LRKEITPCLENGEKKLTYVDILEEDEIAFGSSEFIVLREMKNLDSKYIYYLAKSSFLKTIGFAWKGLQDVKSK